MFCPLYGGGWSRDIVFPPHALEHLRPLHLALFVLEHVGKVVPAHSQLLPWTHHLCQVECGQQAPPESCEVRTILHS